MGSREVVRAKWARESTNPTFVSAPWEETLAQFDMPVPPQDIEADGFKGFLPSTWSEEALKEIPDEILGVYDVAVMWNGEKTMTIEKDCLRWNGGRLTPSAVWCLRTDGILNFRLRFTTFCPGQKTVWVKRGSQQGVIESMDIHFQVNDTDGEATEFEGLFRRQGEGTLDVYTRAKRVNVDHLPTLVRTKSNDPESQCPVCYSEWDEPGVIQMAAPCTHCFCLTCIVDVCSLTPPAVSGSCPICRREMALYDLRTVRRERGGTPDNPGGNPPPSRGCCTPCM